MTLFVLVILTIAILYLIFRRGPRGGATTEPPAAINISVAARGGGGAAYQDDGIPPSNNLGGVILARPVTVETRPSTAFGQVGYITGPAGEILPLVGRRMNRDRWQYYTVSENRLTLKMPVMYRGRDGLDEYGCEEISSGDTVTVNGQSYQVTIYRNNSFQYL